MCTVCGVCGVEEELRSERRRQRCGREQSKHDCDNEWLALALLGNVPAEYLIQGKQGCWIKGLCYEAAKWWKSGGLDCCLLADRTAAQIHTAKYRRAHL